MMGFARIGLERELARWQAIGHTPLLWWRDDDAREPSAALDRLLQLADGLPLALSVIADRPVTGLAARLAKTENVTVGQHGVDHVNRRPKGQPAGEFPLDMPVTAMAHSIGHGRQRMMSCGIEPAFYAPPWNMIDSGLPEALAMAGFDRLSGWNSVQTGLGGLRRLDAHVDLLRWKGGPHFRGRNRFYADLMRQLARRRRANMMTLPIGLLTHHLDHDEAAWSFLGQFLDLAHGQFEFGALPDLIAPGAEAGGAAPPAAA